VALTKVSPSLFATTNNITSVTVGGSANTISLTFDGSGVITGASNNAVSVANTAITGNIVSSQIASVNGSVITANTIANSAIQTGAVENYMSAAGLGFGMRNRIINGAMVIDQRNVGASVTITTGTDYVVDRFFGQGSITSKFTGQQSSTVPTGFKNSLLFTSSAATTPGASDYYYFNQNIEGLNVSDLAWGTASAATVTLSFWVRSSLTGTFSGVALNDGANRSYAFTYTINSANTFEQKSVTIAGDTSGTWLTTNGVGIRLRFALGAGSNFLQTANAWSTGNVVGATGTTQWISTSGATFYITGVQLEKGSTATSFDYRSIGTELFLCMRYYQSVCVTSADTAGSASGIPMRLTAVNNGATSPLTGWQFPVAMRASPSVQTYGGGVAGGSFITNDSGGGSATQSSFSSTDIGSKGIRVNLTGRSNSTYQYWIDCGTGATQLGWTQNAEL